ncbi:hypothetical protein [Agaribacterium sp. ZY112]|uniref:hypothetical protein n=1 Tax=Agaribacterium sp. ZY112 TaxID=3233574 RepID=UPI003526286E
MSYRQPVKQLVVLVCLFAYAAQLFAGSLHRLPTAASKAVFEADSVLTHDSNVELVVSPCHGAASDAAKPIELASSKPQEKSDTCCGNHCQMQGCHTSPALIDLLKSLFVYSAVSQQPFFYQEQSLSQVPSSLYRPPITA